jgi:dethiobiotin synthetase
VNPTARNTLHGCFVTGTDTDAGKTRISTALLHWCVSQGLRSAGYKPVAAGMECVDGVWANDDVRVLRQASSVELTHAEVGPVQFRAACAPHIAAALEELTIDFAALVAQAHALAQRADVLVVEGAGGFCVPLGSSIHAADATDAPDTADLAVALGLPVVLVVGMRLGCINHALLTAEAISTRKLVLAGWVANTVSPGMEYETQNLATLRAELQRRHSAPCLGVVPHLASPSTPQVATHLDALALRTLFQLDSTDVKP